MGEDMAKYSLVGNLYTITYGTQIIQESTLNDRHDITDFSASSRVRMCRYLRGSLSEYNYLITLTYPSDEKTWFGCKRHLKNFIERARRDGLLSHEGASWFWFMEFQERGAPHFHIYTTRRIPKKWLSKTWYECVGSEDEKHLSAGTNICKFEGSERQRAYALKYAAKSEQKGLPIMFKNPENFKKAGETAQSLGRWWGVVGSRKMLSAATSEFADIVPNSEMVEVMQSISLIIKEGFDAKIVKYWRTDYGICFEFSDKTSKWRIYELLKRYTELKWLQLNAIADLNEQLNENSRQRTRDELLATQYAMAKAKREF